MSNMNHHGADSKEEYRGWEYARIGDYHRNLDPNWRYAPTYLRKMKLVHRFISALPQEHNILDAGCGEGVLVEEFSKAGWKIEGIDLNYESKFVRRGEICDMPYENSTFDIVLLLDVFEHLEYAKQPRALREIHRILKPKGRLLAAIPNLAHLSSRVSFFFTGRLHRTDSELNHIGERPSWENQQLLKASGFAITHCKGVTLTVPLIYRVIAHFPAKLTWLHNLLEPFAIPPLAMLNLFFCTKKPSK